MDRREPDHGRVALVTMLGAWTLDGCPGRTLESTLGAHVALRTVQMAVTGGWVQDTEGMLSLTDLGWQLYRERTRDEYRAKE